MNLAVFDIDGTLTDSFGFDTHYFAALRARLGVGGPLRELGQWRHVTDEGIVHEAFEQHGRSATEDDIEWTKRRYEESLRPELTAVPQIQGASAILDHLRERSDWRIAIATGNWTFVAHWKLEAGGVDVSGIPVVGCDGLPQREQVMEEALRRSREAHGEFERVVYLGDAHYDVRATRNLGWPFIGIGRRIAELRTLGAATVLPDYACLDSTLTALHEARPLSE